MHYGLTAREKKLYCIRTRRQRDNRVKVLLIALFVVMPILTVAYFLIPTVATAKEISVTINQKTILLGDFCISAIADHKALGKELTGDLLEVCGGYE